MCGARIRDLLLLLLGIGAHLFTRAWADNLYLLCGFGFYAHPPQKILEQNHVPSSLRQTAAGIVSQLIIPSTRQIVDSTREPGGKEERRRRFGKNMCATIPLIYIQNLNPHRSSGRTTYTVAPIRVSVRHIPYSPKTLLRLSLIRK